MLLSDFITVALIPTLMHTSPSEVNSNDGTQVGHTRRLNSRQLPLPQSSEEGEIFGEDEFFNSDMPSSFSFPNNIQGREENRRRQPIVVDPILREIYEEEKRLDLAGGDFDVSSEEARELINFQRRKLNMMQNLATQAGAVIGVPSQTAPQGRSLFSNRLNRGGDHVAVTHRTTTTTEYPILMSNSPQEETSKPEIITTTAKPATRRFGIGGVFGKVTGGVGNAFSSVHNKIFGGSNTPTTTTTTPPSSNSVYFPDDDKPYQRPPPPANGGPNSIVFTDGVDKPAVSVPLNCTGVQTEYNGACYNVLQPLPCPAGQWLIEDEDTGKGKCVENKCASAPNHAYFGGKCVVVRAEGEHCHKGMITYIFKNGEVECDCKEQYLFNQRDGNCYPAFRRGPCNKGEIFATRITKRGTSPASCMKSKCSEDGFFCNAAACPKDRNCIALKSNCAKGQWDIDPVTLSPACLDFDVFKPDRIIGNVPTLACAPGSRRDILGTCRKPSKITFS